MAKILTFEIPESEYKSMKSFLEECSAEIQKSIEIMKKDQAEIDKIGEDIKLIKAQTDQSKKESDKILKQLLKEHSIFA